LPEPSAEAKRKLDRLLDEWGCSKIGRLRPRPEVPKFEVRRKSESRIPNQRLCRKGCRSATGGCGGGDERAIGSHGGEKGPGEGYDKGTRRVRQGMNTGQTSHKHRPVEPASPLQHAHEGPVCRLLRIISSRANP
jgi:hypothetical protein